MRFAEIKPADTQLGGSETRRVPVGQGPAGLEKLWAQPPTGSRSRTPSSKRRGYEPSDSDPITLSACEANEHRSRRLTSTECAFVEFTKRLGIAGGILKPVHMA